MDLPRGCKPITWELVDFPRGCKPITWELVDLPRGCKPITCKWIFRKNLKSCGSIDKYKARIVVRGFTQKHGIDYFDTYSLATKIATIRTLISLACIHDLVVASNGCENCIFEW